MWGTAALDFRPGMDCLYKNGNLSVYLLHGGSSPFIHASRFVAVQPLLAIARCFWWQIDDRFYAF